MKPSLFLVNLACFFVNGVLALRYDLEQVLFNLNQNKTAQSPLDYWGEWDDHTYFPSPENWRIPTYTIFLDRFVNGDPANDDANGTQWEHDLMSNQFRHGGDVLGLVDSFDYLQGMGIKVRRISWANPFFSIESASSINGHLQGNLHRRYAAYQHALGLRRLFSPRPDPSRPSFRQYRRLAHDDIGSASARHIHYSGKHHGYVSRRPLLTCHMSDP